ncbi:MAG: ABC transporter transmembrane domain-containing protein [Anaerolineae bacterium]
MLRLPSDRRAGRSVRADHAAVEHGGAGRACRGADGRQRSAAIDPRGQELRREPYEEERFGGAVGRAFQISLSIPRLRSILGLLVGFIGFAGMAVILWFGGREALEGRLTGGELIAFLIYGVSIAGSLASLLTLYTSFEQAFARPASVFEILDIQPEITDAPDAQTFGRSRAAHV